MTSSCGPFHEEALRRQRVIDRKRAALTRLSALQREEARFREQQALADEKAKQRRHEAKMRELQAHLNNVREGGAGPKGGSSGHFARVATHPHLVNNRREGYRPTTVMGIPTTAYKNFKGKEKILRNHNLYQAHPAVLWNARPQTQN